MSMSPVSNASFEVGSTLPDLVIEPLSRATLALYAGASGDHVPLHIDIDVARRAGMPDVFGQGMLSAAWLGRLLTSWVEQDRIRSLDLRFVGVFHLYNQAICSGRVVERIELDGQPCVRVDLQLTNQYGEPKVVGVAVVALP
jgi:acyl dehydratase